VQYKSRLAANATLFLRYLCFSAFSLFRGLRCTTLTDFTPAGKIGLYLYRNVSLLPTENVGHHSHHKRSPH
jgi:hypothetical protein